VNWPDGIRVVVVPEHDEMESAGITESAWPQTDDQRREWLAWYHSRTPLERTADDHFFQNDGKNITSTVNSSSRPTSMQRDSTSLPAAGIDA